MKVATGSITSAVQKMYESYPYPHYPLLLPLRWQDGYIGSSLLSSLIRGDRRRTSADREVLVIGSGDVLPYILRHIEPRSHRLTCIDLSQSSINRARFRLLLNSKKTTYQTIDVDNFLKENEKTFHHMDCYGVLMCLPNPSQTLRLMAKRLSPNGTIRMMVYNQKARKWIFHIQRCFNLLGLDIYNPLDLKEAKEIILMMKNHSPSLHFKLNLMGPKTISINARFIDTFFHKREIQVGIREWLEYIKDAGLKPYALYDRYGELDDLKNPLSHMPSINELEERAEDGRFENNLELFLCHQKITKTIPRRPPMKNRWQYMIQTMRSPPSKWFNHEETKNLSYFTKQNLWNKHNRLLFGLTNDNVDHIASKIGTNSIKRLLRIGAILPQQIACPKERERFNQPISETMEKRIWPQGINFHTCEPMIQRIRSVLILRNRYSPRLHSQILERLNKSQE